MSIADFIARIRKRETPFYDRLYRIARKLRTFEAPTIKGFHNALYLENRFRINAWRSFWRIFYYQPLFRSQCVVCGKNLHIYHSGQGLPWIEGNPKISIGNNVKLYDRITLGALTVGENPVIVIGDDTDFPAATGIFIGKEVRVGSHCIIGSSMISDNPGHNVDYRKRSMKVARILIGTVEIGDYVWAGFQSVIVGNVKVGFGAVVAMRAVVTKNVPPFCIVSGNPARIVYKLPFPKEMIETLGGEAYRKYQEAVLGD